jgi:ribose/xylose/arabinose/galactoside ABC-type transport system permease subunit
MEFVATLILFYLAVGAALFAHARYPGVPNDFDWRSQIAIFRATLPEVLAWPLALWRLCYERND